MSYTFSFNNKVNNMDSTVVSTTKSKETVVEAKVYRSNYEDLPKSASKYEMYYTTDTGAIYIGQGKNNALKLVNTGDSIAVTYAVEFKNLPEPTMQNVGYVYRIIDAFTTNDKFLVGEGVDKPAGTSVMCSKNEDGVYQYSIIEGVTDMTDYIKKDDMPSNATDEEIDNLLKELGL